MHAIKNTLDFIGDSLTYRAGRVEITLQWVREDVYTVTTYQGTLRINDNCGAYDTEAEARDVARGYALMYKAEALNAATLADTVPAGRFRQVRPTLAGAQLANVSNAQHRALATAAVLGRVERGGAEGQESVKTLRALNRKGFLRLVMKPGTRKSNIDYGVLTPAGERELERLDDVAEQTERHERLLTRLTSL
jgi:hypothetical protein